MLKCKGLYAVLLCLLTSLAGASMVAHYDFEGNVEDISGNGHHGTIIGNVSVVEDSVRGFVLDCTAGYLNIDSTVAIPNFAANSSITYSAWVKQQATSSGSYVYIIHLGHNGDEPITSLGILSDGRMVSYAETDQPGGNKDQVNSYSGVAVETNGTWAQWHHLAVVYDRSSDIVTFYIDGVESGTNGISKLRDEYGFSWDYAAIGGYAPMSGSPYYVGMVDDVRIYDHALDSGEIEGIYESTRAVEYTADFNLSNNVDLEDFSIFANAWKSQSGQAGYNEICDFVDNDTIDIDDLLFFASDWLWQIPSVWTQPNGAGILDIDPGWTCYGPVADVVLGTSYYYIKNDEAAAIISNIKTSNNGTGTLQKGFVADFVNHDINTETLDWTQFLLKTEMGTEWNEPAYNLALDEISVDGNSILASGMWNYDTDIVASARYTMLDDAPIMKITVTLTNTGSTDFSGYLEYQQDPDSSGGQNAYTPGLGWAISPVSTSGWTDNYIYDGPNTESTVPAHGIAWYENTPTGVLTPGYIFGAWFAADVPAGSSTEISMYHISDGVADANEPYGSIAEWSAKIPELDKEVTGMGLVKGNIVDSVTGLPVSGVSVIAKNILAETIGRTATNSNGDYSLIMPVDVYTLTVSSLYYEFASRSVSMVPATPSILDFQIDPVTVWAGAGKTVGGSLSEAGDDAIVMVNRKLAMSVAVGFDDPQLSGSSKGKPFDMAIKGLADGIDWFNLPYVSYTKPSGTEAWQVTTVVNETVEVLSQTASEAVVRTTGYYSEDPNLAIVTDYTIEPDKSWVTAETTFTNNSTGYFNVWVGDVIDVDEGGQTSYVPGIGDITAGYDFPSEYAPSAPWIAQYGASAQCYGIIYLGDASGMTTYGNCCWIQSQRNISIASGESVVMERLVVCTSTDGYTSKGDAVDEIYQNELAGIESSFALDTDMITGEETAVATVSLTNSSDASFENCSVTLVLPESLQTADTLTVTFAEIAVGATQTASWTISGTSGGTSLVTVNIDCAGNVFSKSVSLYVNGPGWYAGDNHSHSIYSDGSGTIEQNYASAQNKGLSFLTSTDHNTINQQTDVYTYSTSTFLGLLGEEVTSSYGHSLAYNIDRLIDWRQSPQTMINDVISCKGGTGLLYIAHPYYPGLEWDDHTVTNFTGIEVWNGFYAPTHSVNSQAFAWWDECNVNGMHVYGISNSDAHNTGKIGDPHICAWLDALTRENIILALTTGTYYGTDGPALDFSIDGVMMGCDLGIGSASADVTISVSGWHTANITTVTLIKNGTSIQQWTPAATSMSDTVTVTASAGDFYRLVVQTSDGGYAFSNPIWIVE